MSLRSGANPDRQATCSLRQSPTRSPWAPGTPRILRYPRCPGDAYCKGCPGIVFWNIASFRAFLKIPSQLLASSKTSGMRQPSKRHYWGNLCNTHRRRTWRRIRGDFVLDFEIRVITELKLAVLAVVLAVRTSIPVHKATQLGGVPHGRAVNHSRDRSHKSERGSCGAVVAAEISHTVMRKPSPGC